MLRVYSSMQLQKGDVNNT